MPWWNLHGFSREFNSGLIPWLPFMAPAVVWALFWKGIALYKAARNEQKGWFVTLLLLNTLGILEIIYLLFFSTRNAKTKKKV